MHTDLERWLQTFAAGAATIYAWELTSRGWLRTRRTPVHGCCPLLAQWAQVTGGVMESGDGVWEAGAQQGLSPSACGDIMRAADRNPTGYDATLRARLLAICHVEESTP